MVAGVEVVWSPTRLFPAGHSSQVHTFPAGHLSRVHTFLAVRSSPVPTCLGTRSPQTRPTQAERLHLPPKFSGSGEMGRCWRASTTLFRVENDGRGGAGQLEVDMEDRKSVAMEKSEAVHVTFPQGKCL